MNPDEQFDLDMLQAIRMVARDAKGRPDKQDPDVVLARARETIHFQKRRIREVESLHDRRLDEQRRAEREVEELKKQLIDARRLLDGHLAELARLAQKEERLELDVEALKTDKYRLEERIAREAAATPPEVEELRSVNESLAKQVDDLKKRLDRETSPVPGVIEGSFPYTSIDVDMIEQHRGHAYSRLRATVESRIRLEKQLQNGLRACTDGSHPDDAVVSKASVVQALTTLPA